MIIDGGKQVQNSQPPAGTSPGTIGGLIYKNKIALLLTCYHCVFHENFYWDKFLPEDGNDGVSTKEYKNFGKLTEGVRNDLVDIALIQPNEDIVLDPYIQNIGLITGIRELKKHEAGKVKLKKYGSATFFTQGYFNGIAPSTGANYFGEIGNHILRNLIKVEGDGSKCFSEQGDSGSFIVDETNKVVGVIVMGDGNTTFGIPSVEIQNAFGITFKK